MDMNRISTCTYPLREKDLEYTLGVCADAGFVKADVWGRAPHFAEDQFLCDWPNLRALSQKIGIQVANLGTYPGRFFAADSENERMAEMSKMQAAIEAATYFGARSIRVMPGHGEDPAIIARITPYFEQAVAYAAERGVYLGMECHAGSIAGNPPVVADFCAQIGSPYFGVIYEPSNLYAIGVDYREALEILAPCTVHVHIKDGLWIDGTYRRVHLGDGDVDFKWIIEQLDAGGYTGDYALEYEVGDIEPVETGMKKWYDHFVAAMG